MPVRELSDRQVAEKALTLAGYSHIKIHRLYPPRDPGGDAEILFTAKLREGSAAVGPILPYTAYLRDEPGAEPTLCDEW